MGTVISVFLTALLRVVLSVSTAEVAEQVVRRVLLHSLGWIVASTQNTVDDDMAAPIIKALRDGE